MSSPTRSRNPGPPMNFPPLRHGLQSMLDATRRMQGQEEFHLGNDDDGQEEDREGQHQDDDVAVDADDDTDVEEEDDDDDDEEEDDDIIEGVHMDVTPPFDPAALGLKEIGNLASWTVSSCKPGCGVEALRHDDTAQFWQSDGPQPHHLNIHFSRLASIRSIRIFLDFEADESYTPTKIWFLAGTGYHDLTSFSHIEPVQPKGWIEIPLEYAGGGEDGLTLRAFLVQVRVLENHQNGKDTHVRGLKIFANDERFRKGVASIVSENIKKPAKTITKPAENVEASFVAEPDWMGEPQLR